MKTGPLVILVIALSLGTSFAGFTLFQSGQDSNSDSSEIQELSSQIQALQKDNARLLEQLSSLQSQQERPTSQARISQADIEAAVARYMESNPGSGEPSGEFSAKPASVKAKINLESTLSDLMAGNYSEEDWAEVWARIDEAGKTDEAVAAFERWAQADPNNPDKQTTLGLAYLQKLVTVNDGPEKGIWATKADQSFDNALKVNDHHWQARYQKAVSLSFWPPIFGKQPEAIKHFEILREQQEASSKESKHATTYVLLGNLYQQQGKMEKAREIWGKGSSIFPDNKNLKDQLELTKDN